MPGTSQKPESEMSKFGAKKVVLIERTSEKMGNRCLEAILLIALSLGLLSLKRRMEGGVRVDFGGFQFLDEISVCRLGDIKWSHTSGGDLSSHSFLQSKSVNCCLLIVFCLHFLFSEEAQ